MEAKYNNELVIIEDNRKKDFLDILCEHNELLSRISSCERILIKVNIPYWITPKGSLTEMRGLLNLRSWLKHTYSCPVLIVESRYGWIPTKIYQEYGIPADQVRDLFFSPAYKVDGFSVNEKKVSLHISKCVKDKSNFIITMGPPKTHEFVTYSGAVKTCMGFLKEKRRNIHGTNDVSIFRMAKENPDLWFKMVECIQRNLVILEREVKPDLNILDGTSCMEHDGPVFGKEVNWPVLGISNDNVALDYAMCWLMGIDPELIYYIWHGMKGREGFKEEILEMVSSSLSWKEQLISPTGLFRQFQMPSSYHDQIKVSVKLIREVEAWK